MTIAKLMTIVIWAFSESTIGLGIILVIGGFAILGIMKWSAPSALDYILGPLVGLCMILCWIGGFISILMGVCNL